LFLTESDRSRLDTALGGSLGGKVAAVLEEAASRGNVQVPEPVVPEVPVPDPAPEAEPEQGDPVVINSDDVTEPGEGE
jgi:hypothetical protein